MKIPETETSDLTLVAAKYGIIGLMDKYGATQ